MRVTLHVVRVPSVLRGGFARVHLADHPLLGRALLVALLSIVGLAPGVPAGSGRTVVSIPSHQGTLPVSGVPMRPQDAAASPIPMSTRGPGFSRPYYPTGIMPSVPVLADLDGDPYIDRPARR